MNSEERKQINAQLIEKFKQGDQTVLPALIKNNDRLVFKVLRGMTYVKSQDLEDYYQIGLLELFIAAKNFDCSRNVEFHSFAAACIRNRITNERKNYFLRGRRLEDNLDEQGVDAEELENRLIDYDFQIENVDDEYESNWLITKIKEFIPSFNERTQTILKERYFVKPAEYKNISQYCNTLGLSKQRLSSIEEKAIKQLRWAFFHQDEVLSHIDKNFVVEFDKVPQNMKKYLRDHKIKSVNPQYLGELINHKLNTMQRYIIKKRFFSGSRIFIEDVAERCNIDLQWAKTNFQSAMEIIIKNLQSQPKTQIDLQN